jgi:hypothetical protein
MKFLKSEIIEILVLSNDTEIIYDTLNSNNINIKL